MTQEDYKAGRRAQTLERAVALLDDLEFLRLSLANPRPDAGSIRRMSSLLRRFFVDRVLEKVAGPRIGRITVRCPDASWVKQRHERTPLLLYAIAHTEILGVKLANLTLGSGERPEDGAVLNKPNPDERISLSLDDFFKQGTILFKGNWITRWQVVKFIANIADGVHSGEKLDEHEQLVKRARHALTLNVEGDILKVDFDTPAFDAGALPAILSRSQVDVVLLELWATCDHLVSSPDIHALEAYIADETA